VMMHNITLLYRGIYSSRNELIALP